MAGRPRKPTALKLVTGNPGRRKLNKNEPMPKRAVPSCPSHVDDVAKVAWGRLSVLLDGMGVLTVADTYAFERLCQCYAELLTYKALIDKDGATYTTTSVAGGYAIKANPAVAMHADADRRFHSYLQAFGLTPSSRSKVNAVPTADEKEDPLAEFFG
jgi:P27 family predicted phage terminase small subunit